MTEAVAPASTVTFQQEDMYTFLHAAAELMSAHENEINVDKERQKAELDITAYDALERHGGLFILTARDGPKLIGYAVIVIRQHGHYPIRCGFEDAHFLSPSYRRSGLGSRLITETEKRLKTLNVKKIFWHVKPHLDTRAFFERLGYSHSDTIFAKWI